MAENKHISIGRVGEDITARYLENRGFLIRNRNYRVRSGEIDIVAQKDGVLHFVEVKSGSWNNPSWPSEGDAVYRPEDHMHREKCARMARAIQTYLMQQGTADVDWSADLVVVLLNTRTRKARIHVVPDILLGS
jgi:putative endonuclease